MGRSPRGGLSEVVESGVVERRELRGSRRQAWKALREGWNPRCPGDRALPPPLWRKGIATVDLSPLEEGFTGPK